MVQTATALKHAESSYRPHVQQSANQYRVSLILVSVATMVVLLFAASQQSVSILLVYSLLLTIGLTLIRVVVGENNRREARALFLSVYAYNVILAILFFLALESRYGVPYLIGGTDDRFYDMGGRRIASSIDWLDYAVVPGVGPHSKYYGYLYTVALMHKLGDALGGSHTLIPILLNGFVGAWIPVLVYFVAISCRYSLNIAKRAAYAAGFYPLMAFHAAILLRDTIIGFLALYIVYGIFQIWSKSQRWWTHILPLLVATVVFWEFRDSSVLAVGLACFLAIAYCWVLRVQRVHVVVSVLIILILAAVLTRDLWIPLFGSKAVERILIAGEKYEILMEGRSATDSLGLRLTKLPIPFNYLARVAYALIDPLPVPTSDLTRLWKSFGAMLWYGLLPFFLMGLPSQLRNSHKSFLAIVSVSLFFGMALSTLTDRHAVHYAPLFVLFAVDGFERFHRHRLRVLLLAAYAFMWLICGYFALKFVF